MSDEIETKEVKRGVRRTAGNSRSVASSRNEDIRETAEYRRIREEEELRFAQMAQNKICNASNEAYDNIPDSVKGDGSTEQYWIRCLTVNNDYDSANLSHYESQGWKRVHVDRWPEMRKNNLPDALKDCIILGHKILIEKDKIRLLAEHDVWIAHHRKWLNSECGSGITDNPEGSSYKAKNLGSLI